MNTLHEKICISIFATSVDKLLEIIKNDESPYMFCEIRADYLEDLDIQSIKKIKNASKKKTIFTCRSPIEGGKFSSSEKKRVEILQEAIDVGFDYVDIELTTYSDHTFKRTTDTQMILSYHNFQETDPPETLQKSMFEANKQGADIVKIATMINSDIDLLSLYRILVGGLERGLNLIVIGMGESGKTTRLINPVLGSYLTYCSFDSENLTAPGQISCRELHEWMEMTDKLTG